MQAYGSYLGRLLNALAIAVDSSGNSYIAGFTASDHLPDPLVGGLRLPNAGAFSYVIKMNASGSALDYYATLGDETSSPLSAPFAISVAPGGSLTFASLVHSAAALPGSVPVAYVAALDASGSTLLSSRQVVLDSKDATTFSAVRLDPAGNLYLGGRTRSSTFPVVAALQNTTATSLTSLFQSTDGGTSWIPFDQNIAGVGTAIAVHPTNANDLVAGTVNRILRSADGGSSWTATYTVSRVSDLARSPANPNDLFASEWSSIHRSVDGGTTWQYLKNLGGVSVTRLALDPANSNTLYAYSIGGLFKSSDGGVSFTRLGQGTLSAPTSVIVSPAGPIYICTDSVQNSLDGGGTWTVVLPNLNCLGMVLAPSNPSVLYVSTGTQLYKTSNGGANWTFVPASGIVTAVPRLTPRRCI